MIEAKLSQGIRKGEVKVAAFMYVFYSLGVIGSGSGESFSCSRRASEAYYRTIGGLKWTRYQT